LRDQLEALTLERDNVQEEYARMNQEFAEEQTESLKWTLKDIDRQLQERKAEAEWEAKMVAQWTTDMENEECFDEC